jgi:hypothetical protein
MDIVNKRGVKGGQGTGAAEFSDIVARAGSWQYGNDVSTEAIEAEKREQDLKFGVPNSESSGFAGGNPGGLDTLENPHNFSSNPGFMSTGGMLGASTPAGGGVIRGTSARGGLPQAKPGTLGRG